MSVPLKRARILVVEDNLPIQMVLCHLLSKQFDVEVANTIDTALMEARREHFDLFLLDIHLGEERTGVDLLEMLRQMPAYSSTPAVACTAFAGPQYRAHFLASGFNEHVDKPFKRPALIEAIEATLSGKASGKAA